MSSRQLLRHACAAAALALAGCGSSSPGVRPRSSVASLGTVRVSGPAWSTPPSPTHGRAVTAPASRSLDVPSFEMPGGLTENGRDQYGALLAAMLSLVDEIVEAEGQVPLDCSPALDSCRPKWERLSASLHHLVDQLDTPWFDCHGLDAVDARTFVESSRQFKAYVIARVQRIEDRANLAIEKQNWGAAAERSWQALSVQSALEGVRLPSCE